MRTHLWISCTLVMAMVTGARAGDLNVVGNLNVASNLAANTLAVNTTRPVYGSASLSDAEKRFMTKPFSPGNGENTRKVRPIAMICMKHRLNRNEIIKLLAMPIDHETVVPESAICYHYAISGSLCFAFDKDGNLMRVAGVNDLPAVESVTPDTPIELPPVPAEDANKARVSP